MTAMTAMTAMTTTFVPAWMVSLPLVLLCVLVLWCALNASDTNWDVVSGNHDEPEKCGDQVEVDTEDIGTITLTCTLPEGHPSEFDHEAWTDDEHESKWTWRWT